MNQAPRAEKKWLAFQNPRWNDAEEREESLLMVGDFGQ